MTSVPIATYRLQFNPDFGFKEASRVLDYLKQLGVSDIYASPIFKARSGSTHGYDMVDPLEINPELGGRDEFIRLASQVKKQGLGWIQDIIPNHMAYHPENHWLMDVFERGEESPFFSYFDADWDHPAPGLKGRVLAPFLGKPLRDVLEQGELKLVSEKGWVYIQYQDLKFPLRIESVVRIFNHNLEDITQKIGESCSGFKDLCELMKDFDSPEDKTKIKQMIRDLYQENSRVRAYLDQEVRDFNRVVKSSERRDRLDKLLGEQVFCLSFWKRAMEEINYRRFFSINDLISVRMEKKEVFDSFHVLVVDLVKKGFFTGLRIDHVDGLYDPEAYLKRLRREAGDTFLIVEKILGSQEKPASGFPVEGTTGYDWMNRVNQIFVKRQNRGRFSELYSRFTGLSASYDELKADKKRLIIGKSMAGDADNLARMFYEAAQNMGQGQDFTLFGLKRALVEVMAHFSVYRTYAAPGSVRPEDKKVVEEAVKKARRLMPELAHELEFIEKCLLMQSREGEEAALRFQQYTGPIMAKGFEDTLLYVYNRLVSLNEVGGNPRQFGADVSSFHEWNKERQSEQPFSLNATATHDTKRGEDVRARIHVLSEMPDEWEEKIKKWHHMNLGFKSRVKGDLAPDKNDEGFLYQTLVGTYPFQPGGLSQYRERIRGYLVKAVREAKVHTAWIEPDHEYEQAFLDFFKSLMEPGSEFMKDFLPFLKRAAFYGFFNSLSQVLLKMTLPGIPDFYQGREKWDLSLVDPDNRRPVDFSRLKKDLDHIKKISGDPGVWEKLWMERESGRVKMYVVWRALEMRKKFRPVFEKGEYIPLETRGAKKDHILAFARRNRDRWVMVCVPRFVSGLIKENQSLDQAAWKDTRVVLPSEAPRVWDQVLTGESEAFDLEIRAPSIFKTSPVFLGLSKE